MDRVDRAALKGWTLELPPKPPWQGGSAVIGRQLSFFGLSLRCWGPIFRRGAPCQMIPKQCDACQMVGTDKLSSMYWAWMRADRTRVAYLQKLCYACFVDQALPLIVAAMQPVLVCPACGISTVDDHDDVFLTYCVPGESKASSEMPLCGPCAVGVRNKALVGATALEDRQSGGLGAGVGPQPIPSKDVWRSLGIVPR